MGGSQLSFMKPVLLVLVNICVPSAQVKRNSTPPLSLYGQLLWREFFYTAATNNPKFDRMEGNPICIQIPWDRNPEALAKWAEGKTGFPWIDAIMTQLRQEGWIHHLARHAVACFLTRGDLWISWESGVRVSPGIFRYLQEAIRKTKSPWHLLQGWAHRYGFCFVCKSAWKRGFASRLLASQRPDFFLPSTMRL